LAITNPPCSSVSLW